MSDFDSLYQPSLYLSPDQQDALLTALSSNNPTDKSGMADLQSKFGPDSKVPRQSLHGQLDHSPQEGTPGSGYYEFGSEQNPFLNLGYDVGLDSDEAERLIGDLPEMSPGDMEPREKRKSMDGKEDDDESGRKRRESEVSKKPGRKPLTAEPTSVGSLCIPSFCSPFPFVVNETYIKQHRCI
jgi:AP-1-like factor